MEDSMSSICLSIMRRNAYAPKITTVFAKANAKVEIETTCNVLLESNASETVANIVLSANSARKITVNAANIS